MQRKHFIFEFFSLLWAAKNLLFFCLIVISGGAVVFHFDGLKNSTGSWEDSVYAAFTTSLTIGYGDLIPAGRYGRITAIRLGIVGMILVGIVVGASIKALERSK